MIPDAPYIREAERCGCDYMYSWLGYRFYDDDDIRMHIHGDDDYEADLFDEDEDLEMEE